MSSVLCDPLCCLASSVELWAQTYSSSRLRLVTLCCWRTPAGAQNIVSEREGEGRQIKTLWIVRTPPMRVAESCGISQRKAALFSLWKRPQPFLLQWGADLPVNRGGNRDGVLSLRCLLKGRLCKNPKRRTVFEVVNLFSFWLTWHFMFYFKSDLTQIGQSHYITV